MVFWTSTLSKIGRQIGRIWMGQDGTSEVTVEEAAAGDLSGNDYIWQLFMGKRWENLIKRSKTYLLNPWILMDLEVPHFRTNQPDFELLQPKSWWTMPADEVERKGTCFFGTTNCCRWLNHWNWTKIEVFQPLNLVTSFNQQINGSTPFKPHPTGYDTSPASGAEIPGPFRSPWGPGPPTREVFERWAEKPVGLCRIGLVGRPKGGPRPKAQGS